MRTVLIGILILFSHLVTAQVVDSIKTITIGHFAGECMGYCHGAREYDSTELIVSGHLQLIDDNKTHKLYDSIFISDAIDSSGTGIIAHPENETIVVKSKLRKGTWVRLTNSINIKSFYTLPHTIGCPDCTDGGGEWIEVVCSLSSYKVTFDPMNHCDDVEKLLKITHVW